MKNQEVADIFNEIADILDIKGANPFRIRAYRKAAQNIENLTEDIAAIAARNDLEAIPAPRRITSVLETWLYAAV